MASKYSVTLAAEDGYSAAFRGFAEAAENMQQSIRGQQAELRDLNRIGKQMDGYQSLQGDLQATSIALDDAREKQARLAREMRESEQPSKRLANEYDKASATVAGLTAEHRAQTNELDRLQGSLSGAGVDLNRFADEQRRIEEATRQTNAVLEDQRARMQAVGDAQARVTAAQGRVDANRQERSRLRGEIVETLALGYIASRPMNQAMDLQSAMTNLGKVFEFEEGELQKYSNANLRMASDRLVAAGGLGATDLADIQYAAGQSGIFAGMSSEDRYEGVMDFTRQAAIMASAFDISAGDAGSSMVSWRQGMGLDGDQVADLADAVNMVGNSYNTTAADVGKLVTRQGALAVNAGLSSEQTAALAGAFLNPGTQAEVAGTGMKNFLLTLNQGSAATGRRRETWENLGFSPEDLASRMQQDAPSVIQDVLKAIRSLPEDERTGVTETLFGRESISAISPLLANLDEVDRGFQLVSDRARYTGSMLREAETVSDTSRTTWNVMTAETGRLITQIGNGMLPVFEAVAPPISAVIGYMADFTEQNTELVGVLAAGAAGLIAIKAAVLGVRYAGLLIGQVGNQGALMRARLDQRTAQTALVADGAVGRLNAAIGRLAGAAGAVGAGGGRNQRGGTAAAGTAGAAGAAGAAAAAGTASRAAPAVQNGWRGYLANASNSRAGQVAGKVALPLALTAGAIGAANAISGEDSTAADVGSTAGGIIGGFGGWQAGAAGGAALGTMVMPGVGTAVGGVAGGVAGGLAGTAVGSWVGERFGTGWHWAFGDDEGGPKSTDKPASTGSGILGGSSGSFTQQARAAASPVAAQAAAPPPMLAMPAVASAGENAPAESAARSAGGILGGSGKFTEDVRAAATEHRAAIDALDERLANPPSLLAAPSDVAGSITQTNQTDSRVISPVFDIKIEASGNADRDRELLDRLMARLRSELMPMLGAGSSGLDVRLGASLTDRSD